MRQTDLNVIPVSKQLQTALNSRFPAVIPAITTNQLTSFYSLQLQAQHQKKVGLQGEGLLKRLEVACFRKRITGGGA